MNTLKAAMIKWLEAFGNGDASLITDTEVGICGNLEEYMCEEYGEEFLTSPENKPLCELIDMSKWTESHIKRHDGKRSEGFPIGGVDEYMCSDSLYEGEYLEKRKRLALWCAQQLREMEISV